jgi:glucose/arabinose dehydrogenase
LLIAAAVVVALVATACGSPAARTSTSAASTATANGPTAATDIGAGLRGPAGFTATAYTSGLTNVAAFAFDPSGRLWAATASVDDDGTDAVYVVEAPGAMPVKVITATHTPLGLLWIGSELYVSSKSEVDAYSGFDGTRFSTTHTVVHFASGVGELNGLALSPAGRIMLGISAPCNACVVADDHSASIVSFLPDGSDLTTYADGIRAPVGLAYYPGTDNLFVTMNQRDDLDEATPGDWLSVVQQGQSWGFPDCYGQGGSVCAAGPSPVAVLDAHAAVSGIAIVTGQLGTGVGTAAVVAEWAKGEVLAVALDPAAPATPSAPTLLITGMKNPVPVVLGPDNALYLGDWASGTVYRVAGPATAASA